MKKRYQWNKDFSNGDRYNGEATGENVKDGQGEYYWAATGAVYKGNWASDLPHGDGVMTVPDSGSNTGPSPPLLSASSNGRGNDGYTYEGHFEKGQRSGQGTCRFTSGRVYVGEWKMDEMGGQGTLSGAAGGLDNFVEYKGPFLRGRRHGANGCCRYLSGDCYTGDWMQGKRHGQGVLKLKATSTTTVPTTAAASLTTSNGNSPNPPPTPMAAAVEYRGAFVQDKPCCTAGGEVRYADGSTYVGGVADADILREGDGKYKMANGDVYEGSFHANLRHGKGTLQCVAVGSNQASSTYEATWRADQLDGHVDFRRSHPHGQQQQEDEEFEGAAGNGRKPRSLTQKKAGSSAAPRNRFLVAYTGLCVRGAFTGLGARMTFSDQSVYQGEVRDGEPTGQGTLESRRLYETDGVPKAWLTSSSSSSSSAGGADKEVRVMLLRYEGTFFAGKPDGDGTGTFRFLTGDSVTGVASCGDAGQAAARLPKGAKGLRIGYQRGGTFVGKWAHGVPQGSGRWGWDDGDAYEGTVQAGGLPVGHGTYKNAKATYEGNFADGQPSGHGVYRHLLTKETYTGEWAAGLFSGQGEYQQLSRAGRGGGGDGGAAPCLVYKGSWKAGNASGSGVERRTRAASAPSLTKDPVFADAPTLYDGAFKDGIFNGHGKLTICADDNNDREDHTKGKGGGGAVVEAEYVGEFANGTRTGEGRLTLADGTAITGHFVNGSPDGERLEAKFPNGIVYKGAYTHSVPSGSGEIAYPNGDRYQGEVEPASTSGNGTDLQPQRHGTGVFTFVEGNVLRCTWRHNVLHGKGTYTSAATGEVSTRHYVDGVVETHIKPTGDSIFTAENELPNTLSADALRKAQSEGTKPFPFVRKGDGGGIAAANATAHHSTNNPHINSQGGVAATTPHREGKRAVNPSSNNHNGVSASRRPASRRPSPASPLPPGTGVPKPGDRLSSARPQPHPQSRNGRGGGGSPSAEKKTRVSPLPSPHRPPRVAATIPSSGVDLSLVGNSPSTRTPSPASVVVPAAGCGVAAPVRSHAEVQAAIARRMSARHNSSAGKRESRRASPSPSPSPSPTTTTEVPPLQGKRTSLVEVFQAGIGKLDTGATESGDSCATTTTTTTTTATNSQRNMNASDRTATPSRGPLKGQLRAMMEEASAIRDSKEDEVHLLTEELRVLNEKIWQLRFSMTPGERTKRKKSKGSGGGGVASKEESRLTAMIDERKGTVEKLTCLLQADGL